MGEVFRNLGDDFSFGFNFELVGDVQERTLEVSCTVSSCAPIVSYGLLTHVCAHTQTHTHLCVCISL